MFGPQSHIVSLGKYTCLLLAGASLGLLLCEVIVRVFFPEPINPRFIHDSGFGVRDNQPHIRARHSSPGDYEVGISTNSDGLRGSKEYDYRKASGTRRVAVLGDSFAFGYGCNDNQVVSAILEDSLNNGPGSGNKWEVLNFAVSGYGQAEELMLYRNKTRLYKPDVVIVFYFDNDIGNNVVADTFVLGRDGEIHATGKSFLPGTTAQEWIHNILPFRWVLVNSQALSLVRNRLSSLVQHRLLHKVGLKGYGDGNPYGVALTRALLLKVQHEVENDGAHLIVVVIPHNDDPATSNFPITQVESQTLGMSVIDGRDFIDKNDYYVRDGHWRPSGHQKAAQALMPLILEEVPRKRTSLSFKNDGRGGLVNSSRHLTY